MALIRLLANLVIGALMLATADIGTEHGLSFAVYQRTPFGVHGTQLPHLARCRRDVVLIALPVTQGMIAAIGAVSLIATGNWNPVEVIQGDAQGIALLVLLILVVLAQWSTNNSANLIPAALTFINLAPRVINYRMAVVIAGVVGTLCFPWQILDNLFVFLGYYGAFLSAIGGIMVADYYVIRNRRVNVPALYDPEGQYRYHRGFNPAGLIAWLLAGAVAAWWSAYAFVIGFPLGFLL